jgi:Domain of unknown function (DUF397)
MDWRKSSYSAENGNCIEAASDGSVLIRDTRDCVDVTLTVPAGAWRNFIAQLKATSPNGA